MSSYFQDIEHHIILHLEQAKSRLLIAVAWFTNPSLGNEVLKRQIHDTEIVVDDNQINRESEVLLKLQKGKVDVTFVKDLNKLYYLMHNKFCIIDNKLVITGSYNWTKQANKNDENITILKDEATAGYYTQEFRRIKNLKFSNREIVMSDEASKEIVTMIYNELLIVLKTKIGELENGLFYKWSDVKIKNRIRVIEEGLRNNIDDTVGEYVIYQELIAKYGIGFKNLATETEKVIARDNFRKRDLDLIDFYLHREFQFYKIRAIQRLQENYSKLLEQHSEWEEAKRILSIHTFLSREKAEIAEAIGINYA
jgi:hypothetical protein